MLQDQKKLQKLTFWGKRKMVKKSKVCGPNKYAKNQLSVITEKLQKIKGPQ